VEVGGHEGAGAGDGAATAGRGADAGAHAAWAISKKTQDAARTARCMSRWSLPDVLSVLFWLEGTKRKAAERGRRSCWSGPAQEPIGPKANECAWSLAMSPDDCLHAGSDPAKRAAQ
jgi:hypothetical protein